MGIEKRFLLFAGESYYPGGGSCDYRGSFVSLGDAMKALQLRYLYHESIDMDFETDWAEVVEVLPDTLKSAAMWNKDNNTWELK